MLTHRDIKYGNICHKSVREVEVSMTTVEISMENHCSPCVPQCCGLCFEEPYSTQVLGAASKENAGAITAQRRADWAMSEASALSC